MKWTKFTFNREAYLMLLVPILWVIAVGVFIAVLWFFGLPNNQ